MYMLAEAVLLLFKRKRERNSSGSRMKGCRSKIYVYLVRGPEEWVSSRSL